MRFHSLTGSPFVPSSKALRDSRLLFLNAFVRTDALSEHGDGDLDSWNLSIGWTSSGISISLGGLRGSGHGVMASISSTVVGRLDFLDVLDMSRLISRILQSAGVT